MVSQSTIGTMKAGDFIACQNKLDEGELHPLFIVQKVGQPLPYFSAYFIASINSPITSFDPHKNLKLHFVDEHSVSGYICPMNHLYELGVIPYPKKESFSKTNWTIEFAGSHPLVATRVASDPNAIGALSELPADMSRLKILLRYDLIPQDVLFISRDLVRYEKFIKAWFETNRAEILQTLEQSSTKITGLTPFDTEHTIAYQALRQKIERVTGESKIQTFNFDSPFDVFTSVMKMGWKTQALLGGFIAAVFSFGVLMARRFPRVLSALRGEVGKTGDEERK